MSPAFVNRLIHPLAVATVAATLLLIFMGGLVTSHQAGMSVPDWPNSYGYNMFAFPISQWRGGIFYEHTHRLMGSLVGFTSLLMCLHAWGYPKNLKLLGIFGLIVLGLISTLGVWAAIAPRGSFTVAAVAKYGLEFLILMSAIAVYACLCRAPDSRRWLRGLSLAVLLSVLFQGLLGGLRVVLVNLDLAIVHACVAQAFLCLVTLLALMSARSKYAKRSHGETSNIAALKNGKRSHGQATSFSLENAKRSHGDAGLTAFENAKRSHGDLDFSGPLAPVLGGEGDMQSAERRRPLVPAAFVTLVGITCLAIYAQLIVGATMRHFQAGLAIPDLPLAYHHWLPPTDTQQLLDANAQRAFGDFGAPLPPVTLGQIWLHFAHRCGAVLVTGLLGSTVLWILLGTGLSVLRKLAWTLAALLLTQLTLGVLTVLWRKPADIASIHVAVGAATLMTTFILYIRARQPIVSPALDYRAMHFPLAQLSPVTA